VSADNLLFIYLHIYVNQLSPQPSPSGRGGKILWDLRNLIRNGLRNSKIFFVILRDSWVCIFCRDEALSRLYDARG